MILLDPGRRTSGDTVEDELKLVFDSKEIKSIVNQQVDRRRKSLSLHIGARCDSPRQRLGTWVGVSLLNFYPAHGVGQSDPDALGNLAGDADGVAAHREAFAVVGNRRFAQRIQIAQNVAPLGPHASVVHATIELVAQHQRQERTERHARRWVASVLWKMGRVSSRLLAVRKTCSTIHSCL